MPTDTQTAWRTIGNFRCWVNPDCESDALAGDLAAIDERLAAPGARILQDGRNRTVRVTLGPASAPIDAVVKSFGRQSALRDLAQRFTGGSKAERTCDAARHLARHGVDTPQPIACLERWHGRRLVESHFVSRYVDGMTSFREELATLFRDTPECPLFMDLLELVARACRRLHDAGFQHCDLGNQNILLGPAQENGAPRKVYFIDLNRGRCFPRPLTDSERARDLSRISLPSDLLRVFFEMYWDDTPPGDFKRAEKRFRDRFAFHCATRKLRHPFRSRIRAAQAAAAGIVEHSLPAPRDLWIWDPRSEQPIQAWNSRDRRRLIDPRLPFQLAGATIASHLPTLAEYRKLRKEAFSRPVGFDHRISIAVSGRAATFDRELALLRELGARDALVRFHCHDSPAMRADSIDIARRLYAEGFRVSGALLQDRRAVTDPARWRDFCLRTVDAAAPYLDWLEFCHAINRVKWGAWGMRDYEALLAPLPELHRAHPGLAIVGPAVIDWDLPFLQAALRRTPAGFNWDALSCHLYVDRRGAPENRQGGLDALGKFAMARAAVRAAGKHCADRLIVSEVNWPLLGTGVYSPVGAPYPAHGERRNDPSVSEEDYADYLVRYLLIALASGLVDQCVVWRLAAHGFGLVDTVPGDDFRRRPAFMALKRLFAALSGGRFVRRHDIPGADPRAAYRLEFAKVNGAPLFIEWQARRPGAAAQLRIVGDD